MLLPPKWFSVAVIPGCCRLVALTEFDIISFTDGVPSTGSTKISEFCPFSALLDSLPLPLFLLDESIASCDVLSCSLGF